MAHFAKISEQNKVLQVLTLNDKDMLDTEGNPSEAVGQAYLEQNNNWPAHLWIQCSYNTRYGKHRLGGTPFRANYPGIGYDWDSKNQIFWDSEKPYPSWVKNIEQGKWQSPIGDEPDLTQEQKDQNEALTHSWIYVWNETNQTWDLENSPIDLTE